MFISQHVYNTSFFSAIYGGPITPLITIFGHLWGPHHSTYNYTRGPPCRFLPAGRILNLLESGEWEQVPGCFLFENYIPHMPSMYGIFTYICLICMVNVGKYTSPIVLSVREVAGESQTWQISTSLRATRFSNFTKSHVIYFRLLLSIESWLVYLGILESWFMK